MSLFGKDDRSFTDYVLVTLIENNFVLENNNDDDDNDDDDDDNNNRRVYVGW